MKKSCKIYSVFQLASAVVMILALMWLTISTPFVIASQLEVAKKHKMEKTSTPLTGSEEESAKTPGTSTEEKTPGGSSVSEEFLHDNHKGELFLSLSMQYQKSDNAGTYIAFHGELLVPPPNTC